MTISDDITSALTELEGELSDAGEDAEFTLRAVEYGCSKSTHRRGTVVVSGGHEAEITDTIIVRKSLLAAVDPPRSGEKITLAGDTFRILSVGRSVAHYEINIGSAHS